MPSTVFFSVAVLHSSQYKPQPSVCGRTRRRQAYEAAAAKEMGNRLFKAGRFAEAEEKFTQSLAAQSTDATVHTNRSAARAARGDWEGALDDALVAVDLDARWTKVRLSFFPPLQCAQGSHGSDNPNCLGRFSAARAHSASSALLVSPTSSLVGWQTPSSSGAKAVPTVKVLTFRCFISVLTRRARCVASQGHYRCGLSYMKLSQSDKAVEVSSGPARCCYDWLRILHGWSGARLRLT